MTTISDKDRAEAQAMAETLAGCPLSPLGVKAISRWLAVRDRAFASHTCEPEWRPTTAEEIQPGWEIRSRRPDGTEAAWGVAHIQANYGAWFTAAGARLTYDSARWTYETTAPLPAVDHTQVIADTAREYVRCHLAWVSTGREYPYHKWNALVAAVEAEHTEKEEK